MRVVVLYGTETGTSEFAAYDVADEIGRHEVVVEDLAECDVGCLSPDALYLVLCSTYGDGELPASAQPFVAALQQDRPDLAGVRYAMFGLGDTAYPDLYCRGSEIVDSILTELGAERFGDYGRHDASSAVLAGDSAVAWARALPGLA